MATAELFYSISEKLNIYWGLFMFISGLIGNFWNLLVFRHYSLRLSSCSTYIFIGSFCNIIYLIFNLLNDIAEKGSQRHWSIDSLVWCKCHSYISQCASLTALSCLVLSTMDRFYSTCREIKWRTLNSIAIARQVALALAFFWICFTIPTLVYVQPMEVSPGKQSCTSASKIWSNFLTYFFDLCCFGIFPWVLASCFAYLTLRNRYIIRYRRAAPTTSLVLSRMAQIDHELTSIVLAQTIVCILSSIPYCAENFFRYFTRAMSKDDYRQSQEYLFRQIVSLIFYFNFVSTFYINYLSSNICRRVSKQVLTNLFKAKENTSTQITVVNHQECTNPTSNPVEKQRFRTLNVKPISIVTRV